MQNASRKILRGHFFYYNKLVEFGAEDTVDLFKLINNDSPQGKVSVNIDVEVEKGCH